MKKAALFTLGFVAGFYSVTHTIARGIRQGRWYMYDVRAQKYIVREPEIDPMVVRLFVEPQGSDFFGPRPDFMA